MITSTTSFLRSQHITTEYTASSARYGNELRELEELLSGRLSAEWRHTVPAVLVRRAVREASEIARSTDFAPLFLPELAAEQVRRVSTALEETSSYVEAA